MFGVSGPVTPHSHGQAVEEASCLLGLYEEDCKHGRLQKGFRALGFSAQ